MPFCVSDYLGDRDRKNLDEAIEGCLSVDVDASAVSLHDKACVVEIAV